MENQEQNESLDKMIEFLSQRENKEQTLTDVINDLVDKKIENAQVLTEKLIQQEIIQNITLLKNLRKYFNYQNEKNPEFKTN